MLIWIKGALAALWGLLGWKGAAALAAGAVVAFLAWDYRHTKDKLEAAQSDLAVSEAVVKDFKAGQAATAVVSPRLVKDKARVEAGVNNKLAEYKDAEAQSPETKDWGDMPVPDDVLSLLRD